MNTEKRPPVILILNVEYPSGTRQDKQEVDRDEWDAMTARERAALADEVTEAYALNYVNWGWHIDDPDDLSSTES